jgi:hypothetical protein
MIRSDLSFQPRFLRGAVLFAGLAAAVLAAAQAAAAGPLTLGFDILGGFKYDIPPDATGDAAQKQSVQAEKDIPANIKQYDGKRAVVTGFMLPTKLEENTGLVIDFLLVRDPMMCCYGVVPNPNDWIVVHMAKPVPAIQDVPISFVGTLHVGPLYDNGYLTGIYRLDGEKKTD